MDKNVEYVGFQRGFKEFAVFIHHIPRMVIFGSITFSFTVCLPGYIILSLSVGV